MLTSFIHISLCLWCTWKYKVYSLCCENNCMCCRSACNENIEGQWFCTNTDIHNCRANQISCCFFVALIVLVPMYSMVSCSSNHEENILVSLQLQNVKQAKLEKWKWKILWENLAWDHKVIFEVELPVQAP